MARIVANEYILAVGLYDWKIENLHPILTIMFKDVLRTFENEIHKIFKNIRPQPQN